MLHLKTKHTGNSTYKKLAAQWLNEAWFFVSSSLLADSLVLRNRQLLVAEKRYTQAVGTTKINLFLASLFIIFVV